jgi:uncharacterized membrane protein
MQMRQYETTVEVGAPVHHVWATTCDIESLPSWNPTIDAVERSDSGAVRPGSSVRVRQPKLRPATWVVDDVHQDRTFTWHTSGPGYRISAVHLFEPADIGTSVRLQIVMTGILSPVLWALTGRTGRSYVDQEAAALKRRCESSL